MAQRQTVDLQSVKTRQIVYQNPDGTFPTVGAVLNVTDTRGHTDWTRDINADSITLVNNINGDGVLTYSDAGDLLLNGAPVGEGAAIVGGTNITINGGNTVNLDPTKGGGINMLTGTLGFNAGGKNSTVVFDASTTNGTLTVTNTSGTPEIGTRTGAGGPSITLSSENSTNTNTIAMIGAGATSTSAISMTDGAINAAVSYTGSNQKLSLSCNQNTAIFANNASHAIEMGPSLGGIFVTTRDQPISLRRLDASGANTETLLVMEGANTVKVGDVGVAGDPKLQFQTSLANADITLDSTSCLVVSGSGGVTAQIAIPLLDVVTGTAGTAGQVLTSAGAGAAPYWTDGGILGRYWTSVSGEITIDSALFSALTGLSGAVRMRVDLMGGGGGGGGGMSANGSGGGGGQGFNNSGVITHPIGGSLYISVGVGGAGGNGGQVIPSFPTPITIPATSGSSGDSTLIKTSISGRTLMSAAGGGGGGPGPSPTNIGGTGFASGEDGSGGVALGGNGGGYYGGASNQNGGIGGNTSSGTGCGGGGGQSSTVPGGAGGNGDCGYCLIEILEVV